MLTKVCGRCSTEKSVTEFYSKTRFWKYPGSAGYSYVCRDCDKQLKHEKYLANPKAQVIRDRKYHLKRYGLTPDGYNDIFLKQEGRCGGCGYHQSEFNRNFSVDHDHTTGKVRGLLCVGCNLILGYAQDDPEVLSNLIKYLKAHQPESADKNSDVVELRFPKKVG